MDVSYRRVGIDVFGCQTVPNGWQVCDSLSELIRTHDGSHGGRTV